MNGSPSAQSVGSLKPSTAASSASSKRTRSIIVARTIAPDAPVALVPTSSSSSLPGRHTSVHHHHHHAHGHRDAKAVKLNSYAALGSEADVERYERFLSETEPVPHVSDGAAPPSGAVSPPMLAKRRTMDQIPVVSSTTGATLERTQVQDTGDAKQRREAVVQHRKWLKSLPIHERLAYERQQNVLQKWKQINREWHAFKMRTSKKLGKAETQLVMSRASEYREQVERHDALQRALPLSEKVGEDFWLVSLRDDGTRYVPVGNIFSGLYCPIRESSKLQPRIRRPLDYPDVLATPSETDDGLVGHLGKPLTTLERRSMDALARKTRRLKKQLTALFPHQVEPSQSGQLRVVTMDLFEWASASQQTSEFSDYDARNPLLHDPTASTRSLLLPLHEEDHENNADATNSHRSTARSRHTTRTQRSKGPSLRLFLEEASREESSDGTINASLELSFFTDIEVPQQQSVYLENNGTTSLQFQWRRVDLVDDELLARLTMHHTSPLQDPLRVMLTSISQNAGVVFPGEQIEFVFTFQSIRAGTWLEKWLLDVDPPLPGLTDTKSAACVRLQCSAVDNYVPCSQRQALGRRTTEAQTKFMAEQILKHAIIHRVDPQYTIEFPELDATAGLFYHTHRLGAYESVQYSPRLLAQCCDLYAAALALLSPLGAATDSDGMPRETEQPLDLYPLEWDRKLATLQHVVVAADARLESQYMALVAQQFPARQAQGADSDDPDDDEDEEDWMEKLLGTKAREREAQAAALRALMPHFHDDFESVVLSAHVSPYEPRLLAETLAEKLAAMAGETPLILEIARMQTRGLESVEAQACTQLAPLLVRAVDEAFALDQQRERVFKNAKRHFHSVTLAHKKTLVDLPPLLSDSLSPCGKPVVMLLQVDLDIANWFTLCPAADGSVLEWKLSPKLLDHDTYVPPKIQAAAASVDEVLQRAALKGSTLVLVLMTELSSPPMTKAMKKLELASATSKATAVKPSTDSGEPLAPVSPAEIEAARQDLEHKRNRLLTLRGVDCVLQRAMASRGGLTIEFMGSLEELDASTAVEASDAASAHDASHQQPPRVVLMEHLGALARQALNKPTQADAPSAAAAATAPPASEKTKPVVPLAADKKKSVVAMPATPTAKEAAPPSTTAAADDEKDGDELLEPRPGTSLEMTAAETLGQRLAQRAHVLVVDFFPQTWWEATLVYFTAPLPAVSTSMEDTAPNEDAPAVATAVPKHVLVGPQLLQTFSTWQTLFQNSSTAVRACIKAVVGGRGLARKLRLLDGLLDCVDAIFVVGEVAMTIFRVLHTRQVIQSARRARKPVRRLEWQQLIAPVERLMQKAYRRQVELLLPLDFVVGDTRVDLEAKLVDGDEDGDDDDVEEAEEEGEDEDEDDDDENRTKKAKKPTHRTQKPLDEPPEVDTWQPRASYEGERGLVELQASSASWIRFAEVTEHTISSAAVVEGNHVRLEGDDGANDGDQLASLSASPKPAVLPALDWTHRVFDVGPKSMRLLLEQLHHDDFGWLFVNGTFGMVEFREFETATTEILHAVQSAPQLAQSVLVTGKSTATWFRRLGQTAGKPAVVSSSAAKNALVLSHIVETKPHAMLTAFDSI